MKIININGEYFENPALAATFVNCNKNVWPTEDSLMTEYLECRMVCHYRVSIPKVDDKIENVFTLQANYFPSS